LRKLVLGRTWDNQVYIYWSGNKENAPSSRPLEGGAGIEHSEEIGGESLLGRFKKKKSDTQRGKIRGSNLDDQYQGRLLGWVVFFVMMH